MKKLLVLAVVVLGTMVAAATPAAAAPSLLAYGGRSTLSGRLATGQANQKVDIFSQECGAASFGKLTTLTTTTDGSYSFVVQPRKNTTYESRARSLRSTQVLVKVRPKVTLRKLARQRFRVTVLAAESYAGKFVLFQRYSATQRRWLRVRSVALVAGGTLAAPINPTRVSKAVFRARVRARLRVRALLTQVQAGGCNTGSASATI